MQIAQGKQLAMPLAARLEYPLWEKVLKNSGLSDEDTQKIIEKIQSAYVKWDENAFPGMLANVVSGRIANRLNFGGINCTVDAACASSFAALKMAVSELVEYRSDMMLTGGVDTDNSIMAYISFSKTPAVTPGDKVRPFDAKSDGMMLGEGLGMILLKRLDDAVRDGDKIYAVVKGLGTSSDGRYKSIYAPRKEGQVMALRRAYEDAGFAPETVGLIEAHGTGTMAGDPTEFASLKSFFAESDSKQQHIALGSVKSQIGHTKAAAGAASMIKTILALHHKVLPPTINITEPNPKLDIENSSFYLNTETRPWIRAEGEAPRRAGVSSFGFGGTNYHVVLEEYQAEHEQPYRLTPTPYEVLLFAETPAQLLVKCEEVLSNLLSENEDTHFAELTENSKSLEIPLTAARVGFVADSSQEARKFLQITIDLLKNKPSSPSWEHPQGIHYRASGMELKGKVVALFSGQGSQYLEMGRELVMNFPVLRSLYGYMDSLFIKDKQQPVSEVVFPAPVFNSSEKEAQAANLQRTEYAQPAIGMLSAGLFKILQQAGFQPDFTAGHSFGELTALWAAGALSDEDYCMLVKSRGQAMASPKDPNYDAGTMLAVKEDVKKVQDILKNYPHVSIANLNSPNQVVLAGATAEIYKVQQALKQQGISGIVLPVSAAFHTPLIAFAEKAFVNAIKNVTFQHPQLPVYTNVTGKPYPNEPAVIQKILETHLSNPVLFKQEIETIYGSGGYCFVEFGPRKILTNLVKDILGTRPHLAVALNPSGQKDSDRALREAVIQLKVAGLALKNLDPYQIPAKLPKTTKANNKLTVSLNGAAYKTEKSKAVFTKALENGHKVGKIAPLPTPNPTLNPTPNPTPTLKTLNTSPITEISPHTNGQNGHHTNGQNGHNKTRRDAINRVSTHSPNFQETKMEVKSEKSTIHQQTQQQVLQGLEYLLGQFQQTQSENLQIHGTYLNHQIEYVKTFFVLMQQQNTLLHNATSLPEAASDLKPVLMQNLERSMSQFHNQQGETLRIHEQYLQHQVEYNQKFFQLMQQEYGQIVVKQTGGGQASLAAANATALTVSLKPQQSVALPTVPTPATPTAPKVVENNTASVAQPIVQPVAKVIEAPILETVETVKTVEKEETVETVEKEKTAPLIEQKPLPAPEVKPEAKPVSTSITTVPNLSIATSDLATSLLTITSEKTGYPIEMLELDMDMEADLGIDSIKRVEIMGALQEMYPDLPKPENLEELSELRTIGQIVEYLQKSTTDNSTGNASVISIGEAEIITETVETIETSPTVSVPEVIVNNSFTPIEESLQESPQETLPANIEVTAIVDIDLSNLAQDILNITSEKTGYPVEMLELDMDMEADLGIDSIKRVEIMGALQEMHPALPKPDNLEELSELRTIGQIVEYLQKSGGTQKKNSSLKQTMSVSQ